MSEWQPISELNGNRDYVLVCRETHKHSVWIARDVGKRKVIFRRKGGGRLYMEPTHFMSIPATPESSDDR